MLDSNGGKAGSPDFAPALAPTRSFPATADIARTVTLILLVSAALAVRFVGLDAIGYSEDEVNKLRAVEAYRRGDFSANAEHPMLMKLADWGSLALAAAWNRQPRLAALAAISSEAALRLPNALVGSATTAVMFLLGQALFDATVGVWAALFWALDVNAASINRIGKEDTFLVFFLLLASYLHERGKAASAEIARSARWHTWSGVSFGLMLASKYMPWYLGLHSLFNAAADRSAKRYGFERRPSFYLAIGGAFLVANFAILLPHTWRYVFGYVGGDALRHTGRTFANRLYVNTIGATPGGVPPWFYVTFFATKVSLALLLVAAVGFIWAARHPTHRGATFLRVFLVFTVVPYSFVAGKFLRYMLPVMAVIDLAAGVGIMWLLRRIAAVGTRATVLTVSVVVAFCVVAPMVVQTVSSAPYYGLAQNAFGASMFAPGSLFPDDELYDAGVREAVAAVARAAEPGAVVCSDATAVVAEYLRRNGRPDVTPCSMARDGLPMGRVDTWVIAQESHTYFENAAVIDQLHRRSHPWLEVHVKGVSAAQVFHLAYTAPRR